MSAFLISEVKVVDESLASTYRELASLSIEKYQGKYIVRGADPTTLEGKSLDRKIVIVEFPSIEKIKEWYSSPEYKKALEYRDNALIRDLFYVNGLEIVSE